MASYAPVSQKIEGWISVLYIRLVRITPLSTYNIWLWLSSVDSPHISKTADCRPLGVFSSRWKECRLNFRLNDRLQWLAFHHPNYYSLFLTRLNFAQITWNYSSVHLTIACSRHSVFGGEWKRWGSEGSTTGGLSRHSFTDRRQFWRIRERFPPLFSSIESLIQSYQSDKEGMRPEVHKAPFSSVQLSQVKRSTQ